MVFGNPARRMGLEIECIGYEATIRSALAEEGISARFMGYTHEVTDDWKLVTDASVSFPGIELVSPPMSRMEAFPQIRKVAAALLRANVAVDKTCGFHVHHQASDLVSQDLWRLARLYTHFEPVIDLLVSPSRRDQRFCRSMPVARLHWHSALFRDVGWKSFADWMAAAQSRDSVISLSEAGSRQLYRYYKLNFQCLDTYGTVEFRQHQGTLNARKMIMWVDLTQRMVERCKYSLNHRIRKEQAFPTISELERFLWELGIQEAMPQWDYWKDRWRRFQVVEDQR